MIGTLLRVLFGFVMACLAAGFVKVMFVMTPPELLTLPENVMYDRLGDAGVLSLAAATQSAVFAAPFALVAAAIAEWQGLRSLLYYLAIGLAISAGGFTALYAAEIENQPSIVNSYAMTAYTFAGLAGGVVYWLLSGRFSGEPALDDDFGPPPVTKSPPAKPAPRPAAAAPAPPRSSPTPAAPPPSPTPVKRP